MTKNRKNRKKKNDEKDYRSVNQFDSISCDY